MDIYDSVYHGEKMKYPAPEVDAQSIDVSRLRTATGIAGDIGLTGRVTAVVCRGFSLPITIQSNAPRMPKLCADLLYQRAANTPPAILTTG